MKVHAQTIEFLWSGGAGVKKGARGWAVEDAV